MTPEHSTGPAHYRQQGQIPRQRATFVEKPDQSWPASGTDMYTTDWAPRRHRRGRRRARGRAGRTVSILLVVSAAVGGGGYFAVNNTARPATTPATVDAALEPRTSVPPAANRNRPRPATSASPSTSPSATTRKATPKSTRPPQPVAGLNQTQMNNAAVIVKVAQEMGLPRRAMLVAMMTGLQESSLRNLANTTVPASLDRPNEGDGANFDSLGIFQQRPSQGWGTVSQLMTPRYAANAFYEKLIDIADWESRGLGEAAQAVQRSALPDAYDDHQDRAERVVDALL